MTHRKVNTALFKKTAVTGVCILVIAVLLFLAFCPSAGAVGLVDDSVDAAHEYSRYPLENYQLDFYVDNSWGWLPWNWVDGIGKQVMYGLYCITNFIWTINLYLSNASGYLVQEAYGLDFISDAADEIGRNIQSIAGISPSGLSADGFYAGFLLLIILIVGAYVAYTGLIKRETTKAVRAVMNMVLIFVLSGALIAYAPDCVKRLNEFSEDVSTASLSVGAKIVLPDADSSGGDSVSLIRDSLFSIQVKQPWLLLQFGDTDTDAIGEERIESILSASPSENNGEDRENAVKAEIEDNGNTNLTVTKAVSRLGTVFFLFLFNIGISVFVFLLTGMMIFSQVLFIIYAMFLPVSFVLSMVPTFEGSSRRAVIKLFNTILARAGITLVITVAFSISTMLYRIADGYPFFIIAFLQVVVFAGIYFKLGDLLSMFSLHDDGARGMGRYIMHRPRMFLHHQLHRLNRTMRTAGRASRTNTSSTQSSRAGSTGTSGTGSGGSRPNNGTGTGGTGGSRPGGSPAGGTGGNIPVGNMAGQGVPVPGGRSVMPSVAVVGLPDIHAGNSPSGGASGNPSGGTHSTPQDTHGITSGTAPGNPAVSVSCVAFAGGSPSIGGFFGGYGAGASRGDPADMPYPFGRGNLSAKPAGRHIRPMFLPVSNRHQPLTENTVQGAAKPVQATGKAPLPAPQARPAAADAAKPAVSGSPVRKTDMPQHERPTVTAQTKPERQAAPQTEAAKQPVHAENRRTDTASRPAVRQDTDGKPVMPMQENHAAREQAKPAVSRPAVQDTVQKRVPVKGGVRRSKRKYAASPKNRGERDSGTGGKKDGGRSK